MPLLPCFALVSAIGVDSIRSSRVKNAVIGLIFVVGLFQYFDSSFNQHARKTINYRPEEDTSNIDVRYKLYFEETYSIIGAAPPHLKDWKHEEIANSFFRNFHKFKGHSMCIGIIYDETDPAMTSLFTNSIMDYYIYREFMDMNADLKDSIVYVLNKPHETRAFLENIPNMQALLYIDKENAWPGPDELKDIFENKTLYNKRVIELLNSKEKFDLIDRIKLPDGYYANLYIYKIPAIKKDDIEITVFNGKINIFYKDRKITSHKGITSVFVYNGKLYGSENRTVDYVLSPDKNELRMISRWFYPDIIQKIDISIDPANENRVNIKATMQSWRTITLDEWYVNNLIPTGYKEWIRPSFRRTFKKIMPYCVKYKNLDLDYKGPNIVGMVGDINNNLPSLLFESSDEDVPMYMGVSNTNYHEHSRCVYVSSVPAIKLKSGEPKDMLDINITVMTEPQLEEYVQR
jgi:hypothetical protein